jgi:hypothetical protein
VSGVTIAVKPEGALDEPLEPGTDKASATMAQPLGIGAAVGEGKGPEAGSAEDGEGIAGRQRINLRFNLERKGH